LAFEQHQVAAAQVEVRAPVVVGQQSQTEHVAVKVGGDRDIFGVQAYDSDASGHRTLSYHRVSVKNHPVTVLRPVTGASGRVNPEVIDSQVVYDQTGEEFSNPTRQRWL
jgi:hypothetical protein